MSIKDKELEELRSWKIHLFKSMGIAEPSLAQGASTISHQHVFSGQDNTQTLEDIPTQSVREPENIDRFWFLLLIWTH